MKAAVWHSPEHGPALLGLLPPGRGRQVPGTAVIPYKIPPGPMTALFAKGSGPSWEEWAHHLAGRLPYDGRWSVEDVPEGSDAHSALGYVREKYLTQRLDSSQAPG